MKLSTEFCKQLNSIQNFKELDFNDPQIVAIRMRADHELTAMDNNRRQETFKKPGKKVFIYEYYQGEELLAKGTAKEIAEKIGMKSRSVHQMSVPSFHKQINKNKNRYSKKVGVAE